MKVYISADMEGITGVVDWKQCGAPTADHYDYQWARKRMTADVNAAIRGARSAGATQVVVKDSHGTMRNLLIDELEDGIELISGTGGSSAGMMEGIDRSFSCAILVGYHAMAGTQSAIMEHTITGQNFRITINGIECGEIGLSAGIAACFDVPVVAISSDRAGCEEAKALIHGIETAEVKQGIGRYLGKMLHPSVTLPLIEEVCERGVRAFETIDPWLPDLPATVEIVYTTTDHTDKKAQMVGTRRSGPYSVQYTADTFAELHRAVWMLM